MTMTREKIEELKRLAEKATQGEWRQCGGMTPAYRAITSPSGYIVFGMADSTVHTEHGNAINSPNFDEQDANARYIAAANPQTILSLIALAERALRPEEGQFPDAVKQLRSALNAMLTQFGMDEDEYSAATFKHARQAIADTEHIPNFEGLYGETAVQNAELRIAIGAFGMTHEQAVERASQLALPAGPVAWVNSSQLASAKISRERGGPFDLHTWSECKTDFHGSPLYAVNPQPQFHEWDTDGYYAALEKEHLGDPEKGTGIYRPDNCNSPAVAQPVADGSQTGFWKWLDQAYRDGSKGDEFKFTKWNMEAAYRAGMRAVQPVPEGAQPVGTVVLEWKETDHQEYDKVRAVEWIGPCSPPEGTLLYTGSPAVAQPVADERAAFEAWASERRRANKLPLSQHANDAYADTRTYLVWYGWQARAALCLPAEEGGKA